jgi:hypothetical protein
VRTISGRKALNDNANVKAPVCAYAPNVVASCVKVEGNVTRRTDEMFRGTIFSVVLKRGVLFGLEV